jgi:uroporphyrinogen decarboxylase
MADDRLKALAFDHPESIPIGVGFMPSTWMHYREELDALVARHPILFNNPESVGERDYDAVGGTYAEGEHTDRWGCIWSNVASGFEAIVTHHPVPTRESVHTLKAPELIDGSFPHGFMYLRLADLRGFEELMIDFAEEPPELQLLIDTVLDYNMRNLEVRLRNPQDKIILFGDDLGMQHGLPMGPEKWRTYLKPCFARIYAPCRDQGHYVYMHTDGDIIEIIPDLVDCGVNVVNAQIRANGLDRLVAVCQGKVCVDLDLDRQLFPFCTPRDIDDHVREAVEKLGSARGGLWLFAWCGPEVPLENIEAICTALEKYRTYFS